MQMVTDRSLLIMVDHSKTALTLLRILSGISTDYCH